VHRDRYAEETSTGAGNEKDESPPSVD